MEEEKIALRLSGVKKRYKLGQIGGGTLQGDLQSWWAKVRGKEDPNQKIGQKEQLVGESFMALNGIDLTVYQGEVLGIIGCNGAGKSTMLKLLSRVTAPSEGEIDIYGRVSSMLEVGTGFSGQMTGRENIYLNGAILGMTKAEIEERMEDIIEFSEVREFIDTPIKRYSSGMFVKLAFAVAAHLQNEILIMDEVLAVGDMAFQKKCLKKMKEAAWKEGRTILYVSHNMNTISELCSRCIVLDKGKIIFDGDVEEAISIYMNQSIEEDVVDMDLSKKSHTNLKCLPGLELVHLTLQDKVIPIYDSEELLRMKLTVRVTEPKMSAMLRLTFRNDTDLGIGTAWSDPIDFGKEAEEIKEVLFSFPLRGLSKGTFYASIGLYAMDDLGRMQPFDHITRAFKVEVRPKIGMRYWSNRAYGYVQFPKIEAEEVSSKIEQ